MKQPAVELRVLRTVATKMHKLYCLYSQKSEEDRHEWLHCRNDYNPRFPPFIQGSTRIFLPLRRPPSSWLYVKYHAMPHCSVSPLLSCFLKFPQHCNRQISGCLSVIYPFLCGPHFLHWNVGCMSAGLAVCFLYCITCAWINTGTQCVFVEKKMNG